MTPRRHARSVLLCGLALCWAGCSSLTKTPTYQQSAQDKLQIQITTDPPPDADGKVARDAVIHIGFDDYPDPDSIVFGPILLRSGMNSFDAEMKVDLVRKEVVVRPRSLLAPDTQYEVVVGDMVRALSGRRVASSMVAPIPVGESLNPSPSPSPTPAPTWADVSKHIGGRCAPFCHTINRCVGEMGKRNPTIGLDLTKPFDPVVGLVGVDSQLVAGTDHPMKRVAPGDSSRSLLLRKLLGGDPNTGLDPDPDPPMCMHPGEPAPDNLGVPGNRMPLYESACGSCLTDPDGNSFTDPADYYLSVDALERVEAWIDGGANR